MARVIAFGAVLASILAAAPVAAEGPASRIVEVTAQRAPNAQGSGEATGVLVSRKKPCGSKADEYYCGRVIRTPTDTNQLFEGAPIKVSADLGASVLVTWSGTLYCEMKYDPNDTSFPTPRTDFVVDGGISDGTSNTILLGEEGSGRIGRRDYADAERPTYAYYPMTLTRTFVKKTSGQEAYGVRFVSDIRAGYGFCDIHGGALTAVVVAPGG